MVGPDDRLVNGSAGTALTPPLPDGRSRAVQGVCNVQAARRQGGYKRSIQSVCTAGTTAQEGSRPRAQRRRRHASGQRAWRRRGTSNRNSGASESRPITSSSMLSGPRLTATKPAGRVAAAGVGCTSGGVGWAGYQRASTCARAQPDRPAVREAVARGTPQGWPIQDPALPTCQPGRTVDCGLKQRVACAPKLGAAQPAARAAGHLHVPGARGVHHRQVVVMPAAWGWDATASRGWVQLNRGQHVLAAPTVHGSGDRAPRLTPQGRRARRAPAAAAPAAAPAPPPRAGCGGWSAAGDAPPPASRQRWTVPGAPPAPAAAPPGSAPPARLWQNSAGLHVGVSRAYAAALRRRTRRRPALEPALHALLALPCQKNRARARTAVDAPRHILVLVHYRSGVYKEELHPPSRQGQRE